MLTRVRWVVETVSLSSKLLIVIERWRSVYCEACWASDRNWSALVWVAKVSAELEPEALPLVVLADAPPRPNRLKPPPADVVELCDWLFSSWISALESLEFCCW